jgi:hypothetical protein
VDKRRGQLRCLTTIGTGSDGEAINQPYRQGQEWINRHGGQIDLFESYEQMQLEMQRTETILSNIETILPNGT